MARRPSAFNRFAGAAGKVAGTAVQKATSKIGDTIGITDRNIAKGEPVTARPGLGDNRTQVDTYFTKAPRLGEPAQQIYTGDRLWVTVTLTLETAGPVAVGTSSKITPVLGGQGRLLRTGQQTVFKIAKGTKLYVASTGVNRIGREIAPLPWLEQITGLIGIVAERIATRIATGK